MLDQSLPLRPWSGEDRSQQQLPFLITSLINQRGGFQNVTEESLEAEIRNGDMQAEDNASEDEDDEKTTAEQMQANRVEMVRFAQQAFTESGQALDLISLLLTKYTPAAESSVSPYIRQTLPMSTLGAEIVQPSAKPEAKAKSEQLVSTGWRLQALNAAADSMLTSATKLEEEMKKEAKYWDQILRVKQKGWAISRMPKEEHTLGVRFGFLESSPEFWNKSVAALRRTEQDSIKLDFAGDIHKTKTLRARVVYKDSTIAASQDKQDDMDNDSLESAILKGRDNVFDAELFSELIRESRDLVSQGVMSTNSMISVPLHNGALLLIEMADRNAAYHRVEKPNKQFQNIPQLAITMLRILLSYSHTVHYRQRTARPSVIGGKQHTRSSPSLLRPILSCLQHRTNQQTLSDQMASLSRILGSAGVQFELQDLRHSLDLQKLLDSNGSKASRNLAFSLLANLTGNLESVMSYGVSLSFTPARVFTPLTQTSDFSIHLRTRGVGTEYKILLGSIADDSTRALLRETSFHDGDQAIGLITSIVSTYLVRCLAVCSDNRIRSISKSSSDMYVRFSDDQMQSLRLSLSPDKLALLLATSGSRGSDKNMSVLREWTADSENTGDLFTTIEQLVAG